MAKLTLEIKDDGAATALGRAAEALTDLTPLMQEVGEILVASTIDRFREGIGPDGDAWEPKSQTTRQNYIRRGDGDRPRPLIGPTGRLSQNSIHYAAGFDFVEIGSTAIQAAVMQLGAERGQFGAAIGRTKPSEKRPKSQDYFTPLPWGDIPARPFLGLSVEDRGNVEAAVDDWLTRIASGS